MKVKDFAIIVFFLFVLPIQLVSANPEKRHVIIDTDCAPDDLRALNLFLASDAVEILAITSSDGTLKPEEGFLKITSLLRDLGHEGISISKGIVNKGEAPPWQNLAESVKWGEKILSYKEPREIKEFLIETIEREEEPVEFICLGPLTNIANAILMKPAIKLKIKRIVWFDLNRKDLEYTNYTMDSLSADYILNTSIPVHRIKGSSKKLKFSKSFYQKIGEINTPYAKSIYRSHASDSIQKKMKEGHLEIWDELAALYFFNPAMFKEDTAMSGHSDKILEVKENIKVEEELLKILKSPNSRSNVIFDRFPSETTLYRNDIRDFADSIIDKFGLDEWKALVMTGEIHQHLGLYSIVGAKMGVRALEYFHTGPDNIEIVSFAGTQPPLSCFNDGLQVGTGCTLGNGGFSLAQKSTAPKAIITHDYKKIEMELKTKYYNQIQQIIIQAKNRYTMDSEQYWETIRKEGIRIWKEWERKEIFRIKTLN